MEIYYLNIDNLKRKYDKNFLKQYADRDFKSDKNFYEHTIARYLLKKSAENFYHIKSSVISINSKGKPFFKNSDLYFSISHSKDFVVVCFDRKPCGIDIEYIKNTINLEKLSNRFKQKFETVDDFYKFWTCKEAFYKLGSKPIGIYSQKFMKNYCLTVVSSGEINEIPKIKEPDI